MIDQYEIRKRGDIEILYLYINVNYDFSWKDFNEKKKDIETYIREYIKKNKIFFRGNIVNLIIGGFLVGNIVLNNYQVVNDTYQIDNKTKYVSNEVLKKTIDNNAINKIIELNKVNKIKKEEQNKVVNKNITNNKISSGNVKSNKQNKVTTITQANSVKNNNDSNKNSVINGNTTKSVSYKNKKQENVDNNIYINLNHDGRVEKIELEEYLVGVVAAEMPASFHIDALKSQSIISRTYALKARSKGKTLSDNESNQSYKSNEQLKSLWKENYNAYYNKIKKAVTETKGLYLSYNGNYIEAVFHSTSNGKTEDSINVWGNSYPYLKSVESKYDNLNSSFIKTVEISYSEISKKLGYTINMETSFNVLGKTSGNRVSNINIGDKTYTGVNLRNLLGLRSADFDIVKNDNGVLFTTRGYGHGVGLSQYGANGYAKNGYDYKKILLHYYPGVSLKSL